jgi:RHS repeat-associated protein
LLHSTGNTPNNYLFAGEQFDPDLGLYYNRARYLNTSTGRFWSMDAYEGVANDPASLHKYLYASADPVDFTDPSGRQIDEVIALAVQYPLVTMTLVSAGVGGAGGCIAGALDSQSTCQQGFYSGLLGGAVFGAIGGVGGPRSQSRAGNRIQRVGGSIRILCR